ATREHVTHVVLGGPLREVGMPCPAGGRDQFIEDVGSGGLRLEDRLQDRVVLLKTIDIGFGRGTEVRMARDESRHPSAAIRDHQGTRERTEQVHRPAEEIPHALHVTHAAVYVRHQAGKRRRVDCGGGFSA
ncbi:MAG: hypothetical protein ACK55I_07860, partial [bacterium]